MALSSAVLLQHGGQRHGVWPLNAVALPAALQREVKVMKVDVEGQEAAVLQGAQRLLGRPNVWCVARWSWRAQRGMRQVALNAHITARCGGDAGSSWWSLTW